MTKGAPDPGFSYLDIPTVAEAFADGVHQMSWTGQAAYLTLSVNRFDETSANARPSGNRVTSARLILSPNALLELHNRTSEIIDILEATGVISKQTTQ
jgi:hypothetical protein